MIIALILCSVITPLCYTVEAKSQEDGWQFPIMNKIGGLIGKLFFPITFAEGYKVSPSNITIGINEKIIVQAGNYNTSSGQFEPAQDWFFFAERFLSFEAEFPDGNPGGVWFVNFNPPTVSQKSSKLLVTNVSISLASSPIASQPIQDTIIRIKIGDTWVTKNLWFPEDKAYWPPNGEKYKGPLTPTSPLGWLFGAIFNKFGKLSGKILTDYYYVDILVKVKPYHAVKIQALSPSKLAPNEITSIPIIVENQGNYNDTFNFRIRTESGYPLTLTNNATIALQPGEQGQALIGVAVPANVLDTGTLHSIVIDAYSADQPNSSIASQRISLETQGFYYSEQNGAYTIGLGLLFLIVIILVFWWRRKVSQKTAKKPEKPWAIPEEQQHLAELKRTDKKAYEQERLMMEDEYKSALLWYDDYKKSLKKKLKEKKPKKKPKEKPQKQPFSFLKKSEQKPKEIKVEPIIPQEDQSKQKALAQIQRDQQKQQKRMK